MTTNAKPGLEGAVQAMQGLKAEHRDLLAKIAADPGMEPSTRAALVEHVLEEEDEQLAEIASLTGADAPARAEEPPARKPASRPGSGHLTVGSLRPAEPVPPAGRGSIGSLRGD
jgi:hypothetical protein